jgi:hypothetical protein
MIYVMRLAFPSRKRAEALKHRYTAADGAYRYARHAQVPVEGGIMRGMRLLVSVGCFVVMAMGSSSVRAGGGGTIEGGTITFVGAVVEPTCSLMSSDMTQIVGAAQALPSLQRSCSVATSAGAAANTARPYSIDVVSLSGGEPDRVLQYFANYVRAAEPESAHPVLVTQTYE